MNMGRMVIPAIWDVFWDQTDLLTMLVRPPNTLSQKNRHPKKKFFGLFLPSQEVLTEDHKQTVRKMPTNEKIWKFFCEFRSQRVLVLIWCVLYGKCPILSYLCGPNFGFSISVDLTYLHTIEYSTHFLVKNSEKKQNFEKLKNLLEYVRYWKSEVGVWKPWVWRSF